MSKKADWRDEAGLVSTNKYNKKFAYRPIQCADGQRIWFKHYYRHLRIWVQDPVQDFDGQYYQHTDFIENISEEDYIVRKLAETL